MLIPVRVGLHLIPMTSHPPLENSDWGQNLGKDYPLEPVGILRCNRNTPHARTFYQVIVLKIATPFTHLNYSTVK